MIENNGYLIDLDGTLLSGRALLPGARWLLESLKGRFAVVSNDAEHTPAELAMGLGRLGLVVSEQRIILAGTTAIDRVAETMPGARVMLLASASLRRYARRRSLELVNRDCDVVLVGRDRGFTYAKLAAAAQAVASGAALWLACPDGNHRGPAGEPVPETGAIAAAIIAASGATGYHVVGKPEPTLFEAGCARLRRTPDETVMIGDNPATDGEGARRLGMRFLMVKPGDLCPGLFEETGEFA